jgi:hypothetical protein
MNHLLDLIGSYIIGGFLLVALLGLTLHFSTKSQEVKLSEITLRSLNDVGMVIEHDFTKLGYRVESGSKIVSISSNQIVFLSDLNNDGVIDTITYNTYTSNDSLYLTRNASYLAQQQWLIPVKDFEVEGFDDIGAQTGDVNEVQSIKLNIVVEEEGLPDSQANIGSYWTRQFFPKNL